MPKRRTPVPADLAANVQYKCARTCCACRRRRVVHIHHIDQDPSNNSEDNLVGLCGPCHDDAHTKHDLSRNLTAFDLRYAKRKWEEDVRGSLIGRLSIYGHDQFLPPIWMYFNVDQLLRVARGMELELLAIPSMKKARRMGLIDGNGFPDFARSNDDVRSVYERFDASEAHAVHLALSDVVERIVEAAEPIDLSDVWTKILLRALPTQHPIVSINRGMRFRAAENGGRTIREVRYRKSGIELRFQLDPTLIYSNSGFGFFMGNSQVTALLLLRSAATDENSGLMVLKATPLALGCGFQRETDPKPRIAWERDFGDEDEQTEA